MHQNSNQFKSDYLGKLLTKAFESWAKHSGLTFVKTSHSLADIVINFNKKDFDGPGGTLAFASLPVGIHFTINKRI